jgi:streptomycin 6-kinase
MPEMLTGAQIKNMAKEWGRDACVSISDRVGMYSNKWKLSDLIFHENYSMNAIFFCKSEQYGECILKLGVSIKNEDFISEYNVLREYNGRRFAKVYESDIDIKAGRKAMLIERIAPGTPLYSEPISENRMNVFANLYKGLHIKPKDPSLYMTCGEKMEYFEKIIGSRSDSKDLHSHMLMACDIYTSVSTNYNKEMLLHGDLHFNNILLGGDGRYTIIDPQGLIGDPVFDVPRYIMIAYYHYINTIKNYRINKENSLAQRIEFVNTMINYLSRVLDIPESILRQCFYVEMITMECWDATVRRYDISNAEFADMILRNLNA